LDDKESIVNALFMVQAGYISTRRFAEILMELKNKAIEDAVSYRDSLTQP